jgi:hypothetical protein
VVQLPATGLSVFFLDDTTGWVVTPRGIYRSDEGGRSWRKLPKSPRDVLRVWFLDSERGYAVGVGRNVHQTVNGGKSWQPLPAAADVKSDPDYTVYSGISFAGSIGYITGWSRPPRRDGGRLPDWMEPERAVARKEWPNMSILLGTLDRGQTWKAVFSSIFGQITRLRLAADGRAVSLIEFRHDAPYPSEVIAIDTKTGGSKRVYANKTRAVTDVALAPSGPAYLAASAVPGRLMRSPIPGRLHIMQSDDMQLWRDMEVDYRANARRAVLAAADARNVWVATDTGMILKLAQ